MAKDKSPYDIEEVQKNISKNLRQLMEENNLNQKQFSEIMDISESTFSGYMKENKVPNLSFIASIKKHYPNLSMDDFLFSDLSLKETNLVSAQNSLSNSDSCKYHGSYYLFYLDTSKKTYTKSESNAYETIDLRFGIIYISNINIAKKSGVKCLALMGIKNRDEIQQIKSQIDMLENFDQAYEYLKNNYPRCLYCGEFNISQMHIFISLNKVSDSKDNAFIILHHTTMNKDHYSGGLGTINSVSTGRSSDPIVQMIAISKKNPQISVEQIKSALRFKSPEILLRGEPETGEIIRLAESFGNQKNEHGSSPTIQINLNEENRKTLLHSLLACLISRNIENNCLWQGRVSSNDDDTWYHILKESETYHEKQSQGDGYGYENANL